MPPVGELQNFTPLVTRNKLVLDVVLVPYELSLHFSDLDVGVIEFAYNVRCSVFLE